MTPGDLLKILRARGYVVSVGPDGRVSASGVEPKDPKRAQEMLEEHEAGLVAILSAEQILGATLR